MPSMGLPPMTSATTPASLREFAEAAATLVNRHAAEWLRERRAVGYFCSSMPEELLTAAGLLPFRVRGTGSQGSDLADAHFSSTNCSFPRHCLNQALLGEYDFLSGLVVFNSCDSLRRIYDHWIKELKTPFVKLLHLPKKADPPQVKFFRDELAELKRQIEEQFEVQITDDGLRDAIRLHNRTRRLLRQLYELRKADHPPITGAETLAVTVAGTAMPKARFNELLENLLAELGNGRRVPDHRARLMIVGSELDDPAYIEVIESLGGLVVTDSLCFGSRLLWNEVREDGGDPLAALAQYYIADRPTCPRVATEYGSRLDFLTDMVRDFRVDGVILERLAFCDLWGFEGYSLHEDFKSRGVPFLSVEREYRQSAAGQLRTRVQAFLESMAG